MANTGMTRDPYRAKRMRVYFRFSMIGVGMVLIFALGALILGVGRNKSIDYSQSTFVQYETPEDSAPVVVFETTEGTFKAVLYDKEAPEYCEFFTDLVNKGYFDNTYVCTLLRSGGVTGGFIAGSKTTDGTAAEDTVTDMVNVEISPNLLPTKGALGSLTKEGGTFSKPKAGSVFTVLSDVVDVEEMHKSVTEDVNGASKVMSLFEKYGGVPNFMQMYTLFAQVYDGWDALDKIFASKMVDENTPDDKEDRNLQPDHEIKFTKVWMSTYGQQKQNGFNIPLKQGSVKIVETTSSEASSDTDSSN
ncbi:MAG: peptidylprolyl isomerase [Ruminococcus sp.]|nr:peptidylprolyl isomerase [Ruminococcus sp.]